jgi:hypothetical protein
MKNKIPSFKEAQKIVGLDKKIVYCPICERGYLLEEEKEKIKEVGCCWSCWVKGTLSQQLADKQPYATENKFCSECGTELEEGLDEDWDFDEEGQHFVVFPYLYCPRCKERVLTHKPETYVNDAGETLPF